MNASKRALITGVTGQDGSYLAEFLLGKGYDVWGLVRRASGSNLDRIEHLLAGKGQQDRHLQICHGDVSDLGSINAAIEISRPDEVYSLAAQSHVHVSFEVPEYTADVTGLGTLRVLQAMRDTRINAKFFHAGSSEQFGLTGFESQNEDTPFNPRSPYACAKVFAYNMTRVFRESYGMYAANGILFNHESPRRAQTFVTRKISQAVAAFARGRPETLLLGNLNARRDWGFAADYVDAMWRILQHSSADDFVIATGTTHSVRQFCELAFAHVGIPITWIGKGLDEQGLGPDGSVLVRVDPRYFRPADVDFLQGDATKAREQLGWEPTTLLEDLVRMMIDADVAALDIADKRL